MAFNGRYLVKVGTYEIPLSIMKVDTYQSSPAQRQDLDAYRDADGKMHRNTLDHTATKIEFETVMLSEHDFRGLIDSIIAQYTVPLERKVSLTYYDDEHGNYRTGDFYLPATWTFKRYNKNIYNSFRIAFIEY